jgi:urease accessory protein
MRASGLTSKGATAALLAALLPTGAEAHHVMDGKMPTTFLEGLLSGLGHPVIGPDHLAFIIAIGIGAALVPAGFRLIAAFVAASTAGVLAHAAYVGLPLVEAMVALSVVLAGLLLATGNGAARSGWLVLAALFGLFHGYAFGEAVVGAERGVIGAYLVGIAIIASVIAWALMQVTRRVVAGDGAASPRLKAAGVMVSCIGAVMLVGALVPW